MNQKTLSEKIASGELSRPKIICLCGSTKYADIHAINKWELEQTGNTICLMISYIPRWYADQQGYKEPDHIGEQAGVKSKLDELHLRKIDLADEIFVINVGGYIGESTYNEICYAKKNNKPVKFLEGIAAGTGIYYKCKED
jgi:hypothetical protein